MPEELPAIRTQVAIEDVAAALCVAWQTLWGETPSKQSLLVLLAQSSLETGRYKSTWCYNLGNAKGRDGDGRDWCHFRCSEIIDGKEIFFDPPHPQTRFRAFRSLNDGACDYLAMMRKNFAKAWPMVIAGDPERFVRALKAQGYFTAAVEPYVKSVVSLFSTFQGLQFEPAPIPIDDATKGRIASMVADSLTDISRGIDDGSPGSGEA